MSVGIVVVSHSRALAEGAVDLATQMVTTTQPRLAVAAGTALSCLSVQSTNSWQRFCETPCR